jgi:hypothetical protein
MVDLQYEFVHVLYNDQIEQNLHHKNYMYSDDHDHDKVNVLLKQLDWEQQFDTKQTNKQKD